MQDRLQPTPLAGLGEHLLAHGVAIKRPGRVDDQWTELGANRLDCRTAWRCQCMRDQIGINHRRAPSGEQIGHLRLS